MFALVLVACDGGSPTDAGTDAGGDSGAMTAEAGRDSGSVMTDAGGDSGSKTTRLRRFQPQNQAPREARRLIWV